MSWRVGRNVPLNVYDGDRPVCQCHTADDAARIVNAINAIAGNANVTTHRIAIGELGLPAQDLNCLLDLLPPMGNPGFADAFQFLDMDMYVFRDPAPFTRPNRRFGSYSLGRFMGAFLSKGVDPTILTTSACWRTAPLNCRKRAIRAHRSLAASDPLNTSAHFLPHIRESLGLERTENE